MTGPAHFVAIFSPQIAETRCSAVHKSCSVSSAYNATVIMADRNIFLLIETAILIFAPDGSVCILSTLFYSYRVAGGMYYPLLFARKNDQS